jgi:hypothetical protein
MGFVCADRGEEMQCSGRLSTVAGDIHKVIHIPTAHT